EVNKDGEVVAAEAEEKVMPLEGIWLDVSEGHFVGLHPIPEVTTPFAVNAAALEGNYLFRAEVKRVLENERVIVSVAKDVAAALHEGDGFVLFRPAGISTEKIKRLPDSFVIGAKPRSDPATASVDQELNAAQSAAHLAASRNNLKQIGLACYNFESAFGR